MTAPLVVSYSEERLTPCTRLGEEVLVMQDESKQRDSRGLRCATQRETDRSDWDYARVRMSCIAGPCRSSSWALALATEGSHHDGTFPSQKNFFDQAGLIHTPPLRGLLHSNALHIQPGSCGRSFRVTSRGKRTYHTSSRYPPPLPFPFSHLVGQPAT